MSLAKDTIFMRRALELAGRGSLTSRPNPMVGAVIVHEDKIIGEGFHLRTGLPHAEVNAIENAPQELLKDSTIYVTLEPCSHHGLTPPCAELLVEKKFKRVVVGTIDTSSKVSGRGISILEKGGCVVDKGILDSECREINKRFFAFHEKGRPYIILKWAQSSDGFIDRIRSENEKPGPNWITGEMEKTLVHRWRAEEHSILIGSNTLRTDNPELTTRKIEGPNPLRLVLSRSGSFPGGLKLIEDDMETILFTKSRINIKKPKQNILIENQADSIDIVLGELVRREIQSLIVEGGANLLTQFIERDLWDEARIFYGNRNFGSGIASPVIEGVIVKENEFDDSKLIYLNP